MAQTPEVKTPKRALLSVSDKTGIVEFAKGLRERGVSLISTGQGSMKYCFFGQIRVSKNDKGDRSRLCFTASRIA